jgi:hypothetical protein
VGGASHAPDWSAVSAPEEIAASLLSAPARANPLLWQAVATQGYGPPFDDLLLALWPDVPEANGLVLERARHAQLLPPAWRAAALGRALGVLSGHALAAADLVVALDDADALAALDEALLTRWPDPEAARVIARRLDPDVTVRIGRPPGAAWRLRALDKARAALVGPEVARAAALVFSAGTAEDARRALDAALDAWPRRVPAELMIRHLADGSEAWRQRARAKSDRVVASWGRHAPEVTSDDVARAAQLLFELDHAAPCPRLLELKTLAALDRGYYLKLPARCPAPAPPRREERR